MEVKGTSFSVGDTVAVYQKIQEQEKTRSQVFEGTVLAINSTAKSFTVRKISGGIGVERIWPANSPWIEKVVLVKKPKKVQRAKLYHLRGLTQKEAARVVA